MENDSLQIDITAQDEMNRVKTSLTNKMRSLPPFTKNTISIYKVPEHMRKGNEDHYRPLIVSIGPIFYKDSRLKSMREYKLGVLKYFLEHKDNDCPNLENYIDYVRDKERKIRDSYEEHISISRDEFIEMIVIDAVFLVCYFNWNDRYINFPFFENKLQGKLLAASIDRDLLVVENQIPYYIVNDIYDMAFGKEVGHTAYSFTRLVLRNFCYLFIGIKSTEVDEEKVTNYQSEIIHLLDLIALVIHLWGEDWQSGTSTDSASCIDKLCCGLCHLNWESEDLPKYNGRISKTAKQLKDAGVKFEKSDNHNILDITFKHGKLVFPSLFITETTEPFWRNIIYFEQSHPGRSTPFTDYVLLLDALIDTVEDVQVLVEAEIIDNDLGSDLDTLNLFNKVGRYWQTNGSIYDEVSKKANAYASTPWNQWMATLRTKYFYNPWVVISVFAAFLLFVLTLLQTIASYAYK